MSKSINIFMDDQEKEYLDNLKEAIVKQKGLIKRDFGWRNMFIMLADEYKKNNPDLEL